tara:strand:+ start:4456 stop:5385 length:930 start_codon:yes stop_codon:yes gene_type:complete
MTVANTISKLLPRQTADWLRPKYHWYFIKRELTTHGGSFRYDKEFGGWILQVQMPDGRNMPVVARTFREFRRVSQFGREAGEPVWKWLNWMDDGSTLYDVGSANGLEGFTAGHLHGGTVCFIEPYTPSIETILKTVYFAEQQGSEATFEVVHAGCSSEEGYSRLEIHGVPLAGLTRNTYGGRESYEEGGGRNRGNPTVKQWVKGVTLDCLSDVYGLPKADYVKIDVDGHETSVMAGAQQLLKDGCVKSWAIELTADERIDSISQMMLDYGYVIADDYEHYPGTIPRTVDRIFLRPDILDSWNDFKVALL